MSPIEKAVQSSVRTYGQPSAAAPDRCSVTLCSELRRGVRCPRGLTEASPAGCRIHACPGKVQRLSRKTPENCTAGPSLLSSQNPTTGECRGAKSIDVARVSKSRVADCKLPADETNSFVKRSNSTIPPWHLARLICPDFPLPSHSALGRTIQRIQDFY